ncbi:response regulator [Sinosporangium siamense]|uniref:DNA-binding response regulator n=1 Tax=Sinosporangium siamense TaxID=1367973 RepID=A0A919RKA9_9ACTN|nr:response regulator transcription factor [Sinosporangium siamense]GII93596.1 DNA-binding response regulator [Sinosporangium siamense]
MIRVVLVEDQELVRAGLRALLGNDPGITIAGEAGSGRTGLSLTRELKPDVVLMDIRMPDMSGLEATALITGDENLRHTRVLILTTFDDDEDIAEAVRIGAAGYILKDIPADDLRRAVHTVAAGDNYLTPSITRRVMNLARAPRPEPPDPRLATLTPRELAVLHRVSLGESNEEIAEALFISPATARTYISRLLTKLDARDRTALAVLAHRSGLPDR